MPRPNDQAAELLQEMADLMAMLGRDPFRVRSYEKAAAAVQAHPKDIDQLDLHGLQQIPSVGKSMASRLEEFLEKGTITDLEDLRTHVPSGVRDLTRIPGLGPKTAMALFTERKISSVEELVDAIKKGKLVGMKGFGPKTADNVLKGIEQMKQAGSRVLLDTAFDIAESMLAGLRSLHEVKDLCFAGSLRRMKETIGDIDLLVASMNAKPIMERFTNMSEVEDVIARGDTKSAVRARGMQIDLRVIEPDAWGAALIYFTGSKDHNVKIREIAVKKGMKLNEYGLFKLEDDSRIAAKTEEEVYEALGLPWIPPTLRENSGEIEAARSGTLPNIVSEKDLRGDLHTHTTLTDGHGTLEEMIQAASDRGYEYYAITDHAGDFMAMQRTTREKLLEQRARIAKLQRKFPKMHLLQGLELNIQPDGSVDYDPDFLSSFDILVASVHSHFNLSRDEQTRRLITAIENPNVHIIGHPTGRQIIRRKPIDIDAEAVFKAAAATGTAMEVNAHPDRLDLRDEHARLARSMGVTLSIDSDAHQIAHLHGIRYGVATAQRGWVERKDVLNCRTLKQLAAFVSRKRGDQTKRGEK
ncbi:MAG: DNA polymerase/3'-5' exonuclease PolX [Actinomycetota bacterium]